MADSEVFESVGACCAVVVHVDRHLPGVFQGMLRDPRSVERQHLRNVSEPEHDGQELSRKESC